MLVIKRWLTAVALLLLASGAAEAASLVARYSTLIGAPGPRSNDTATAVAVDSHGNVYVAGETRYDVTQQQSPFPSTPGSLVIPDVNQTADNPCVYGCGFVMKLDPQHRVVYVALIHSLKIQALAVDSNGSAYTTGWITGGYSFPSTPGVFSDDPVGRAFVFKLNPEGSALEYCARFVGEEGKSIVVDDEGSAYVAGFVDTPGLPTTPGALKPNYQATGDTINFDGFLIKIAPSGQQIHYGTYLGGTGKDRVWGVAVDPDGIAIVVGSTDSADFLNSEPKGGDDGFVARLSADGSTMLKTRRLGGQAGEYVAAVASDPSGGIIVSGATESTHFPVTTGVIQPMLLGERNGFIARLDSSLNLTYSTYFGGTFIDGLLAAAVGQDGSAYLTGTTFSPDMLTTTGAFQGGPADVAADPMANVGEQFRLEPTELSRDAFVAVLSPDGASLSYGTYLGGFYTVPRHFDPLSFGAAIARAPDGKVVVAGSTTTTDFPVTGDGVSQGLDGIAAGFLTEFEPSEFLIVDPFILPDGRIDRTYHHTLTAQGGVGPYRWSVVGFRLPEGLSLSSDGTISGKFREAEETNGYQFTVRVADARGSTAYKSLHITTLGPLGTICKDGRCVVEVSVGTPMILAARIPARGVAPFYLETSGVLPPGVVKDADQDGRWSGTTQYRGTYTFAATVRDSVGQVVSLTWEITVRDEVPSDGDDGGGSGGGSLNLLSVIALLLMGVARLSSARIRV